MHSAEKRPDPDLLLRRVKSAEQKDSRAKLKIFFGFAPGVGKTFRMLQAARELVLQKTNVLIGLVETHRRPETTELLFGLDLMARRKVEYRGRILEEFDLDAALKQKPDLIVVDELAHTNAPGSRHAKRWQDVLELLDAGIHVYTTLNVQHVESLNDVIEQITQIQVRETVPDSILERADEIELVDVPPEELLARLREGKVYLPEQAARAAQNFFQRGNLLALRELALRHTVERVDADVQAYREEYGVDTPWQTSERILVCVGPSPASARLVRAAKRMAAGLRASWAASYVDASALTPMSGADRERLESHLRLVEALGGSVVRLSGLRVSEAIIDYARRHNVTRIIIGKPTHSRLRDRLRGSLLDEIVRGSGDIDVHVITGDSAKTESRGEFFLKTSRGSPWGYIWAAGGVAAMTGVASIVRVLFSIPDIQMLYLLAVMGTAFCFERGPSILAAALSVAAYDFFFVPPYFTFAVADGRYMLTFTMMFGVGLLLSTLTTRIRQHEKEAVAREERTSALYALSRDLGGAVDVIEAARLTARHARDIFAVNSAVVGFDPQGTLVILASSPDLAGFDAKDLGVAKWVIEHGRMAGAGTDTLPGSRVLCVPLVITGHTVGVLALAAGGSREFSVEQRGFLDAFCRQAAFAFERARLGSEAKISALRAKTEELRSSLLSTVSHDLRTPLAVITGAATTLREKIELPQETRRELLDAICEEAQRLERLLANLLDMTRLDSGEVVLKREWVPLIELVGGALTRLEQTLREHRVIAKLPDDLPLVSVDPILMEQLFINLLENAAKYTPQNTQIEIVAFVAEPNVVVEILDRGPGIAAGEEERIFERFHRGNHVGVGGAGLGLPICRSIALAHGGTLIARNREGGGAMFRLTLRQVGEAPSLLTVGGLKT